VREPGTTPRLDAHGATAISRETVAAAHDTGPVLRQNLLGQLLVG
jgi:hypothetical protein